MLRWPVPAQRIAVVADLTPQSRIPAEAGVVMPVVAEAVVAMPKAAVVAVDMKAADTGNAELDSQI